MSGGGAETEDTGLQVVVGSGQGGCGGDADGGSGGGTNGGGGGDVSDRGGAILSWWEDNIENPTLGKDPNVLLAYGLVLEHHHQIMSTLGDPGGGLER